MATQKLTNFCVFFSMHADMTAVQYNPIKWFQIKLKTVNADRSHPMENTKQTSV